MEYSREIDFGTVEAVASLSRSVKQAEARKSELCRRSEFPAESLVLGWKALGAEGSGYVGSQAFLFCWLWLYDREALAGRSLRRGDRGALARIMGLNSPTSVSARARDLGFLYKTYPWFRDMCRRLLANAETMAKNS